MTFSVIALYPVRLSGLAGQPGVRFRKRRNRDVTLVPCVIETVDRISVARVERAVPDGTPPPLFKAQFEIERVAVEARRSVCVLLAADRPAAKMDPEQTVFSPIFDDGHRMIFEFRRAHVLIVDARGHVEMRFVAVDPTSGVIGTKTVYEFHTRYSPLAARCGEYLAGSIDLFPAPPRAHQARRVEIPAGQANLSFPRVDARDRRSPA